MRENCTSGSVRGASGNRGSYRRGGTLTSAWGWQTTCLRCFGISEVRTSLLPCTIQFIEGPFRLILRGATLVVNIESSPVTSGLSDRAKLLATGYIDNLGRNLAENCWLLTEEEFVNLPPWASQNEAMARSASHQRRALGQEDTGRALRDARHSVISYHWPLKACYDYMQNAATADEQFVPEIYKMIETMENHLGGEANLCHKTGLVNDVKFLKRISNEGHRDERHAPKNQTPPQPLTGAERTRAHHCATRVLRKFEDLCRGEGLRGLNREYPV